MKIKIEQETRNNIRGSIKNVPSCVMPQYADYHKPCPVIDINNKDLFFNMKFV